MAIKNNNNLFYTCSLIEYIGRQIKRKRYEVVDLLTKERIKRIYKYADILHCEPIEKVADEFITECSMNNGNYDNIHDNKNRYYNLISCHLSTNDTLSIYHEVSHHH